MLAVTETLLPVPSKRRSGQKIDKVAFIVAHDTGNDGSTASGNVSYYIKSANEIEASAHFFVDDKAIIRCIPESEKAWHVRYGVPQDNAMYGKDSNDAAIAVELCYASNDPVRSMQAYKNYVELMAVLCAKYGLDPKKDIVGHYTLDPDRRTDPLNAFKFIKKTWFQFIDDVTMAGKPAPSSQTKPIAQVALIRQKMKEVDDILTSLLN